MLNHATQVLPSNKSRSNEGSFIGLSAEPSALSPPLTGAPGAASRVKLVDSNRGGSSRSDFAFDGRGSGRSCDSSLEDDEDSKRGGVRVDVDASHGHGGEEGEGEEGREGNDKQGEGRKGHTRGMAWEHGVAAAAAGRSSLAEAP